MTPPTPAAPAPVKARRLALRADQALGAAWAETVAAQLAHARPNAQTIAAGRHTPAHVKQLRVAIRRLRSAAKLFAPHGAALPTPALETLAQLARDLGATRNADVLREALAPELARAGAPPIAWPSASPIAGPDAGACARRPEVARAWALLAEAAQAPSAADSPPASVLLETLARWRRSLRRQALGFADMDDTARHDLRKRVKRLRYGLDCCAGLLAPRATKREARALAAIQQTLGQYNDAVDALPLLTRLAMVDPRAWFAVGWLRARLPHLEQRAAQALAAWRQG